MDYHDYLVISWTPFDKIQWPNDTINEYPINPDTSITGQPTNLYGVTQVSYNDESNQGTNPEYCDFYNYIINRTWQAQAGAYNFSNSPSATHIQLIGSEDTQPPYLVSNTHEGDTAYLAWYSDYSYEGIGWNVIYEDLASSANLEFNDVILEGSEEERYILAQRNFTSKDVCGNQTSKPTSYFYERKLYTDIPEYSSNIDVGVYPNPTSGNINIKYNFKPNEKLKTELYNITGQKLEQRVFNSNSSPTMDLSKYSAGIYFLKSKTSDGTDVDKIVKK